MTDNLIGHVFCDLTEGDHFKIIQRSKDEPGVFETATAQYPEDLRSVSVEDGTWISEAQLLERIKLGTVEDVSR